MPKLKVFNTSLLLFSVSFILIAIISAEDVDQTVERHYLKRVNENHHDNLDAVPSDIEGDFLHFESFHEQRDLITIKTLSHKGNNGTPTSSFPLQKCQGDCDNDTDCASTLKCFRRKPGDDILKIPGCTTNSITALTNGGTDYCYNPNDAISAPTQPLPPVPVSSPISAPATKRGTILYKGEDWTPRDAYPLDICEGDCDGDYDCEGELVCHHRDPNDEGRVPSCVGRDTTTRDYCIHPSDEIANPPVPNAFRFKKFWQYGYKWQDEFWEQEWCMECSGGSDEACEVNDSIVISHCSHDRSTWFVYKNQNDDISQIQIAINSNLCLQLVGNNDIQVRVCDGTKQRQKFKALNGKFGAAKFELGTIERDGCISQHHHPKDGEIVFRMDCALTRKHTTSYWTQY